MGTTVSGIIRVGDQLGARPHRRLAHLPVPRRRARADHDRPHLRAATRRQRPHHRRGGRGASAPFGAHARARRRRRGARDRHPRRSTTRPATAGCSAPTASAATSTRTGSRTILATIRTAQGAADRLVKESLDHGAPDNVTVVLVDIDDSGGASGGPTLVRRRRLDAAELRRRDRAAARSVCPPCCCIRSSRARREDTHFEPESEGYLDELIEEDTRRASAGAGSSGSRSSSLAVDRAHHRRRSSPTSGRSRTTSSARTRAGSSSSRASSRTSARSRSRRCTRPPRSTSPICPTFQQRRGRGDDQRRQPSRRHGHRRSARGRGGAVTTSIRTDGAAGRPVDAGPRATFTGSIRIKLRTPAKLRNLELGLLLVRARSSARRAIVLVQFGAHRHARHRVLPALRCRSSSSCSCSTSRCASSRRTPTRSCCPIAVAAQRARHRPDPPHRHRPTAWRAGRRSPCARSSGPRSRSSLAIAVLLVVRNHRVLQRYRYVAMFTGVVLLLLPLVPGLGPHGQRRERLDRRRPVLVPARRAREDRARDLLRRLPGDRTATPCRWSGARSSASGSRVPATSGRSS